MVPKIGIIGLPNVGKTTLFNILTESQKKIGNYPFTTIEPNKGICYLPDKRLEELKKIIKPEKVKYSYFEIIDVAGLIKNAHKGEGLGNEFLSYIRSNDLVIEVIRMFDEKNHYYGGLDLKRDLNIINDELLLKDLEIIERREKVLKKKLNYSDFSYFEKLKDFLLEEDFKKVNSIISAKNFLGIKEKDLISLIPKIFLINIKEDDNIKNLENLKEIFEKNNLKFIYFDLKKASEDLNYKNNLIEKLLGLCYNELKLKTFYVFKGMKELRSFIVKEDTNYKKAASLVHSDFSERFIKASVIKYEDFLKFKDPTLLKKQGLVKFKGKEEIVNDGEIIEFII